MSAKRDLVTEIEGVRGRTGPTDWDNGITKLLFLCNQIQKIGPRDRRAILLSRCLFRCAGGRFPLGDSKSSGFGRYQIHQECSSRRITNHNRSRSPHREPRQTSNDRGIKIAHSVSFSNLDAINRTMGQLLRADFLDLVKNARDSEERRAQGENAPLILPSISDTLAKVSKSADERLSPKLSPKSSNFA